MQQSFSFIGSAILFLACCLAACNKAGEGGAAEIHGTVTVNERSQFSGDFIRSYPAEDVRVYIVYGDNNGFDDDVRTRYDGSFSFPSLYKGDYSIYVYSECRSQSDDCPSGNLAVVHNVELKKLREQLDLGEIFISDYK